MEQEHFVRGMGTEGICVLAIEGRRIIRRIVGQSGYVERLITPSYQGSRRSAKQNGRQYAPWVALNRSIVPVRKFDTR